jgi:predicted outer membrane protein
MKDTPKQNPTKGARIRTRRSPFRLCATAFTAVAMGTALLLATHSMAETKKSTLGPDDEKFVQKASVSGKTMVKISTLAMEKAGRGDVKAFAGTLVSDHRKANEDLTKLALAKGVALTTALTPEQDQMIASLENLDGAEFDKVFISTVQTGHKKCSESFEWAATEAKDTEVKSWAISMLPTLKLHLTKANDLGSLKTDGEGPDADNTARNTRDQDAASLTPFDQGNSETDTDITARIRKAIMANDGMSMNARNVKIITQNGMVTLRGPVKSAEEKRQIGDIAGKIAGENKSDNQLEVESAGSGE